MSFRFRGISFARMAIYVLMVEASVVSSVVADFVVVNDAAAAAAAADVASCLQIMVHVRSLLFKFKINGNVPQSLFFENAKRERRRFCTMHETIDPCDEV